MQIVNRVFRTRLEDCKNLNLHKLSKIIPNANLKPGKPTQLQIVLQPNNGVVGGSKLTCLLFGNGGVRIMGKGDLFEAYDFLLTTLAHFTKETPTMVLQNNDGHSCSSYTR